MCNPWNYMLIKFILLIYMDRKKMHVLSTSALNFVLKYELQLTVKMFYNLQYIVLHIKISHVI